MESLNQLVKTNQAKAGRSKTEEPTDTPTAEASATIEPQESAANSLVVYFSWSGNTQTVAKRLEGLPLGSSEAADSGEAVAQWLSSIGMAG